MYLTFTPQESEQDCTPEFHHPHHKGMYIQNAIRLTIPCDTFLLFMLTGSMRRYQRGISFSVSHGLCNDDNQTPRETSRPPFPFYTISGGGIRQIHVTRRVGI